MFKKILKLSTLAAFMYGSVQAQTQVHPLTQATVTGSIITTIAEVQTIIGSKLATGCDDKSPFLNLTVTVRGRLPAPGKIAFPAMTIAGIAYPSTTLTNAIGNGGQELYLQQGQIAGISVRRSGSGATANYTGDNLTDLLAGDSVEVTGVLKEFQGMSQLEPTNVTSIGQVSNLPAQINGQQVEGISPLTITNIGNLNNSLSQNNLENGEMYEGMYVEIKDVTLQLVDNIAVNRPVMVLVDASGNKIFLADRFKAGRSPLFSSTSASSPVRAGEGRLILPVVGQKYKSVRGMLYHAKTATATNSCTSPSGEFVTFATAGYQIHPWHPSQYELESDIPPIISNIVTPIAAIEDESIIISANIAPQAPFTVASAIVYYSTDTLNYSTWANVTMTGTGNAYTGTIPANTFSNEQFVYYYIVATDNRQFTSVVPNVPVTFSGILGTAKPSFFVVRNEGLQIKDVQYTPFANGRSGYENKVVTLTGIVTATVKDPGQNMSNVVIQQEGATEWGGLILGTTGLLSNVDMGQKIKVQGTVIETSSGGSTFTTMNQISAVSVEGTGTITPLEMSVNTFSGNYNFYKHEKYEGMLVKLVNPVSSERLFVVDTNADYTASSRSNFWEYRIGTDNSQLALLPTSVTGADRNILISGTRVLTGRGASTNSPNSQFVSLITKHVNTFTGGADTNTVKSNAGRIIYVNSQISFKSMTGIMQNSFGNMKLLPRNNADIELISVPGLNSSANDITNFTLQGGYVGTVSGNTISVRVPKGTVISNLTASGVISLLATVNPSFATAKNYTSPVLYTVTAQNLTTKVYTVNVTVLSTTGVVSSTDTENKITLFPNPAENEVIIKGISSGDNVTIYNAIGTVVFVSKSTDSELKINTSSLDAGLYFVRLAASKTTLKLIINK